MKNIKFLLGLLTVVILMASCVTTQGAMDDDMDDPRTQQIGNRVYLQDPYYGTVVLERDPFTGRYYDVTYGSRIGAGAGYYGRPYGGFNRGGYSRGGNVGRGRVIQQAPARQEAPQNREAIRKKVLGN